MLSQSFEFEIITDIPFKFRILNGDQKSISKLLKLGERLLQ